MYGMCGGAFIQQKSTAVSHLDSGVYELGFAWQMHQRQWEIHVPGRMPGGDLVQRALMASAVQYTPDLHSPPDLPEFVFGFSIAFLSASDGTPKWKYWNVEVQAC